jgi:aminopeptidase
MYNDFAPRLARVLTEYSTPVRKGDLVIIWGGLVSLELVEALQYEVLQKGGHLSTQLNTPSWAEMFYRHASDEQLKYVDPIVKAAFENVDILYSIRGATNTKMLAGIDPARMQLNQRASKPLMDIYNKREAAGDLRWTISGWPTMANAQEAEMGFLEYQEFVYKACGLHHEDPVAYWREFKDKQAKLVEWLKGKKQVEVRGPGVELSLSVEGRGWISAHGEKNFPDGEIFTCPVEDSVNGHVEFSYPSVYGGRLVEGVQLTFKDGKVVEACAEKGEDYLYSQLDADEGSRFLGEFAIGTNMGIRRFTREILFDEKMGGTIHLALGRGFPQIGGKNDSVVHWDMVHDMMQGGEVLVDGELFYRAGEFMVE